MFLLFLIDINEQKRPQWQEHQHARKIIGWLLGVPQYPVYAISLMLGCAVMDRISVSFVFPFTALMLIQLNTWLPQNNDPNVNLLMGS